MTKKNNGYRRFSRNKQWAGVLGICGLALSAPGHAQTNGGQLGPGLLGSGLVYNNAIETAAAASNDLVFRTLDDDCNPDGVLDSLPSPQFSDISGRQGTPGPSCTPDTFFVYLNARELFQTANELQGQGPTIASLGTDLEGLGKALRWTAAEELAAQGSMSTEFANSQLATLASRLNALRFGATGFRTVGLYQWMKDTSPLVAQAGGAGAPEEGPREEYTPWGGFLNYGFGYGNKLSTPLEDAFDFDGSEITLGVDYRLRSNVVLGGIFGFTGQKIDFDASANAISVVDGGINSDGKSFMVFVLSQKEHMTISGSLGTQSLDYDVERDIRYPSFNPNTEATSSVAISHPKSDVTTATFEFSWAFNWTKVTLEPFFDFEYLDATIGSFSENRSINLLSNTNQSRRFDLVVSEQNFQSLKGSAGLRFQYVATPRFGVVVPYLSFATHKETKDDARTITAGYAALENILGSTTFKLRTDMPDTSYYTASVGVSLILRGGRQREVDGPIRGGVSGFFQFSTVGDREFYKDQVMTAGFRYEF